MTIKEKILAMQETIDKLSAELDVFRKSAVDEGGLWKPEIGEEYYSVSGTDYHDSYEYYGDEFDIGCISIGNCFKTRELAEKHREKLKVMQRLREISGGFKPDDVNYYVIYKCKTNAYRVEPFYLRRAGLICFATEEHAQAAIDELGSRLDVLFE